MKIRPVGAELFYADRRTDKCDEQQSLFAILRRRLKYDAAECDSYDNYLAIILKKCH